ncbi:MAG: hypothetical protein V4615_03445 [Bacteroidota bacterium]
MIRLLTICFVLIALFAAMDIHASTTTATDSADKIIAVHGKAIIQNINLEKRRIALTYRTADLHFYKRIDSAVQFIAELKVPALKKNEYLTRLHVFLKNINRSYSDSYFKSGTYLTLLGYYPKLLTWDTKGELLQNIKSQSNLSIKAIRLVPNDTVAEIFLTDYLNDHSDDIFRYTEEFDDREFALALLEKATRIAPESAKRYFVTVNQVNTILAKSNDLFVKKAYEIFSRFGAKSRSYLLIDAIIHKKMSLEEAEAISTNPNRMFQSLIRLATTPECNVSYSAYRYMENYCIDVMRKYNYEDTDSASALFKSYTSNEMFALLCYGHKECTVETFGKIVEALNKKPAPVNGKMLPALNKARLSELAIYCDKNQLSQKLLSAVDEEGKNYLRLLSSKPKENLAAASGKTAIKASTEKVNKTPEHVAVTPNTLSASAGNTIVVSSKKMDFVPLPEPVEPIKITLDEKLKTKISLKKNIVQTIQNIPSFIQQDYAEDLLSYAAHKEPDELFKKVEDFKNNRFSKTILEQCALNAPVSLKRYLFNPRHAVNFILQYSSDPVIKKIFEINPQIGSKSKPLLLLDDIMNEKLSVKDAISVSSEPDKLFHALVRIVSRPQHIGKYSIDHEMRNYSLRFIREINDKIANGEVSPFASAENFSSSELYFLMLYGRDEVFTSTFNGLFSRFMQKLPKEDGDYFLHSVNNNQFRNFLSLCSTFGTLEEFLTKFSVEAKQQLLVSYISKLEIEKDDLSTIVLVAEAISNLSDHQSLSLLQTHIKKEYERVKAANDQIGISVYGVLSSMISGNAKVETVWYKRVSEQFRISPVSTLVSTTLFNQSKACIQQMYFYNDDDGRSSFVNFLNTYRNQTAWIIEDKKSYVRIYAKGGVHIEIFANNPDFEETGISAINKYLKEKGIAPSVVIHRGHSFHTESTLEKISSSAKLIFVGSCGGFYKVSIALENAPDAHIISTKQIGTKVINDAMLFALNENIRSGKDIIWNDFWDKMRLKLGSNQYFSDYVPPNKNLEAIFIRAYYKLLGV